MNADSARSLSAAGSVSNRLFFLDRAGQGFAPRCTPMLPDGQIHGKLNRGPHAAGIRAVSADDVERCAVIGAGSDDGEA